jgi:Holliday junction resolvase RusA-like endonuclease
VTTSTSEAVSFVLRIEGQPQGKDRPRHNPFIQKRPYTTKKTVVGEREVRAAWEEQGMPRFPDEVGIILEVVNIQSRPKSHFNSKGELNKTGQSYPLPHNKKPDFDNAAKLIGDALNSRAWRDDVRICKFLYEREWGEWPATVIRASIHPAYV